MKSVFKDLEKLLKKDERFVSHDGKVMRNAVQEAANKMDEKLLNLLLSNDGIKKLFFKDINGTLIFDKQEFNFVINNREMLPDSYTRYKQDIGLIDNKNDFISSTNDVVLSFPFKDCVLEFDSTDPDKKREEVFYNEVLAYNEIDHLFEKKVFTNVKFIDKDGEKIIDKFLGGGGGLKDNLLIKGNNLLVMHSLLPKYKEKVKLIYWDILYNKDKDYVPYTDSFKHSSWLVMMKNRLEVAKQLLKDDGVICLQCDDIEMHYLKVLCDEIFGRENFIDTVINQSANSVFGPRATSKEKTIVKTKDYIIIYTKCQLTKLFPLYTKSEKPIYDSHEFFYYDKKKISTSDYFKTNYKKYFDKYKLDITKANIILLLNLEKDLYKKILPEIENIFYEAVACDSKLPDEIENRLSNGDIVEYNGVKYCRESKGKGKLRFLRTLKESCKITDDYVSEYTKADILGDVWNTSSAYQNINAEGDVELLNGKKPEHLIKNLLKMFTEDGDIVLDAYFGTGTTGAVAMKMGRHFIGIEQLDEHIKLSKERLINVINGDKTGISKIVNWQGGGSFVYCELKKLNQMFIDEIIKTNDKMVLVDIWNRIINTGFVSCKVNLDKVKELIESPKNISIDDIKKILIELLDKNQLYVNYSDMDDEEFGISEDDKKFTNSFYEVI